jgi:uncharacterized protein (TIGR02246 family)
VSKSYRGQPHSPIGTGRTGAQYAANHLLQEQAMQAQAKTLINLEMQFWQSIKDSDPDAAIALLCDQSLMVSSHGAMKFGHEEYRKMAEQGPQVLTAYELTNMDVLFPNDDTAVVSYHASQTMAPRGKSAGGDRQEKNYTSTWVRENGDWKCAAHTETAADQTQR